MTYSDAFNLRTTSVKFNDIADAIDGTLTRTFVSTTTGTSTAYIATPSPAWQNYSDAPSLVIIPHVTNTVGSPSVTLNVNGLGAKAIKRGGVNINAAALIANVPTYLVFNSSSDCFEILIIENAIKQDGSNTPSANLPMGGFKHTGVSTSTSGLALNEYSPITHVQNGTYIWLGTAGGTATALTASANPAITSYVTGQTFRIKTSLASTGTQYQSHTLNINSLGAKEIYEPNDSYFPAIGAGAWGAGAVLELLYDGTYFVKMNNTSLWQTWSPTVTLGGGTMSGLTVSAARFFVNNLQATVLFRATFTVSAATSAHGYVQVTLPREITSGNNATYASYMTSNSIKIIGEVRNQGGSAVRHYLDPSLSQIWTNGPGGSQFVITYECI